MTEGTIIDETLDTAREATEGSDEVTVQALIDAYGERAHGPLILTVSIAAMSPLGAVPLATDLFAALLLAFALQYALRDGRPWLPRWIARRKVGAERLRGAIDRMRPWVSWLGWLARERLVWATRRPWSRLAGLCIATVAASMFLIGFIPGAVVAPGLVTALAGLGVAARDGLLLWGAAAVGLGLAGAAVSTVL